MSDTSAPPPLDRRRVFASHNVDETAAFMQVKEFELILAPRDVPAFDFVATAAYLPNSYVGYVRYGAAAQVRVPPERRRDDFFIHLPLTGRSRVENCAGGALCAPGQAVVSSPAGHLMYSEEQSDRITVSLTKSAMMGHLASLLGDAPRRALEFAPSIQLTSVEGRRFARHVNLLIADLDDPASARNSVLLGTYEQLLMTSLLLCQHNTYTDVLSRLEGSTAPRAVKRAIDYIEGNLTRSVTLADIVAASGSPGRTLLKHFHDHYGTSPMRHLRDARLGRIRQELLRTQSGKTVAEIAMDFGIQHGGRFATEYRRRFGETPSETARRAGRLRKVSSTRLSNVDSSEKS